jgi:glycine/D-amino acid oxidase-like deaminating enzyme
MTTSPSRSAEARTVHVVGGGLAGLTAAALVARAGHRVVVHEQSRRLGGRARTDERDGYRFNRGPHALYLGGEGLPILQALGVDLAGATPSTTGARMVVDGRSHLMPTGATTLAVTRAAGARDKVDLGRVLARIGSIEPASMAHTSVSDWVDTVTDRPRAAAVLRALVRLSTYVNDSDTLSAEVGLLQLQRSLAAGVRYLDGGWESLVAQLAVLVERAGGRIERSVAVDELPDAAAVIVAVGGPEVAARLVGRAFDVGAPSQASVLDLALSAPPHHRFVIGVDEALYLSDHGFVGQMSPPGGASVSLGRYLAPDDRPTVDSGRSTLRTFARHAGITDDAVVDERYLHRMTTVSAIATAHQGGLAGRAPVRVEDRPGVFLAGDWVGPRGHLADAVLASAEEAARRAIAHVERSVAA